MYTYKTRGVCSRAIEFDLKDGKITSCRFIDGCTGNTQGVAALVTGMDALQEAIRRLKGIQCRSGTSCPDQLALALEQALASAQ